MEQPIPSTPWICHTSNGTKSEWLIHLSLLTPLQASVKPQAGTAITTHITMCVPSQQAASPGLWDTSLVSHGEQSRSGKLKECREKGQDGNFHIIYSTTVLFFLNRGCLIVWKKSVNLYEGTIVKEDNPKICWRTTLVGGEQFLCPQEPLSGK